MEVCRGNAPRSQLYESCASLTTLADQSGRRGRTCTGTRHSSSATRSIRPAVLLYTTRLKLVRTTRVARAGHEVGRWPPDKPCLFSAALRGRLALPSNRQFKIHAPSIYEAIKMVSVEGSAPTRPCGHEFLRLACILFPPRCEKWSPRPVPPRLLGCDTLGLVIKIRLVGLR